MIKPSAATTVRKTPNFDFLFGRYSHSAVSIPYFQVNMTFNDAASYLSLVSDMPGSSSMEWRIEELFQRDIDWARVQNKIVPYLKQDKNPQFFNALTVALLPFKDSTLTDFSDGDWKSPTLEEEERFFDKAVSFGPIRCGFWQHWESIEEDQSRLGQMAWNRQEVAGVAIDGQHRLAAIKRVAEGQNSPYSHCTIPVIFVVLDPALGYSGLSGRDGVIGTLRQLFIDLNKHAKVPSRGRQILLDDRDPASICVRGCVGERIRGGRAELDETPKRLPLSLVDWHSEQAKFDDGPYLTTVLGLDWAVGHLLNVGPLQDMLAYDYLERANRKLESRLEISLEDAKYRLDEDERYERPFAFVDAELSRIRRGFEETWATALVELLTTLKPYAELLDKRTKTDTLRPEFSNWYALKQRAEQSRANQEATTLLESFERELADRIDEPVAPTDFRSAVEEINELKLRRGLAFTVVFQRALVMAYAMLLKISNAMLDRTDLEKIDPDVLFSEEEDEETNAEVEELGHREQRARELTRALNIVLENEPSFLMKDYDFETHNNEDIDRFWVGSFAQLEGAIDFSQAASSRGSEFLLATALMYLMHTSQGIEEFDRIMERIEEPQGGLDRKLQECFGRLSNTNNNSVAKRVLAGRDNEVTVDNAREVVTPRLRWIWDQLMLGLIG